MQEKAFIESIYNESLRKDRISKGLANTLNILTKTVFGEANRFVFELLQNADDAPKQKGVADVEVEFILLNKYLIFRHNGGHFTQADVNGISDIGSRESEKDKDGDKTGYKGIGFKSVFGTSDCVQIVSRNYSFRFDKNHEPWKDTQDHPWQVVPIWTESIPTETLPYVQRDYVNTIIQISDKGKVAAEINAVFQDCQIALFLRNIKCISFLDAQKLIFKIEKKQTENGLRGLYKNGQLLSHWITKDFVVDITADLREKLNKLSKEECPDKLKFAKSTKISFAAFIKENQIVALEDPFLYCYLPTKVRKGFPFIANADFITNAERTQFLENDWNSFLFGNIAIKLIEWCADLQKTALKFQVTRLLRGNFNSYSLTISEKAYNQNLQLALSQIPFLPEQKGFDLIKLKESIVDTTGFTKHFSNNLVKQYLKSPFKIVDLEVVDSQKLIDLGAINFGIEKLTGLLSNGMQSLVEKGAKVTNKNLIDFLFEKTEYNTNPGWLEHLKKTTFLLDESGGYKTPKEIYFPLSENKKEAIDFLSLNSIDNDVFIYLSATKEKLKWLHELGVKEPSALEIVRKSIVKIVEEDKITDNNSLAIMRFVFKVFKSGKFNDQDYQHLSKLKIRTTNGLQSTINSYLPDEYQPELPIRTILPDLNFVSIEYPESLLERPQWKLLFTKIGVRERISISVDPNRVERVLFIKNHPQTNEYFEWLDANEYYPSLYKPWKNSGQHYISNFTFVDYVEKLNVHTYSKSFWKANFNNWDAFIAKCSQTRYSHKGGSESVPSYIQYYVKTHPTIPATDGICYPSTKVYTSHLKPIVGKFFPVADFDHYVTKEQAEFLGFKWTISFEDSFTILRKLVASNPSAEVFSQISAVYGQLVKMSKDLSREELAEIRQWRETGKLLTLNNSYQSVDKLSCFAVRGLSAPADSSHFIKLPVEFSFEDTKALCLLFEIPLITFDKLQFQPTHAEEESSLHKVLSLKAKYFSLIYAHQKSEQPEKVLQRVIRKVSDTIFYKAELLSMVFKQDGNEEIYNSQIESWFVGKSFYYVGEWNSALTLYSLSSTICTFLDIKGIERELVLILQLKDSEILKWLNDKGYKHNFETTPEEVSRPGEPNQPGETVSVKEPEITIVIGDFRPEVKPAEVVFENVVTETKVSGTVKTPPSASYGNIQNEQTRLDVGKWSEEFIYKYLKNEHPDSQIVWENELSESGKPYDFRVISNDKEIFIEVKGTPSEGKPNVYLSENEWRFMFEKGESYFIYRLFNAGEENLRVKIIPNPGELAIKGEILPSPIELIL